LRRHLSGDPASPPPVVAPAVSEPRSPAQATVPARAVNAATAATARRRLAPARRQHRQLVSSFEQARPEDAAGTLEDHERHLSGFL